MDAEPSERRRVEAERRSVSIRLFTEKLRRSRRGSNPGNSAPLDPSETARNTEKTATDVNEPAPMSERVSAFVGAQKPEPSDAELEAAIVAAMLDGRAAVAEMLAERLRERRHARAGNVVALAERERNGKVK